MENCEDVEYLIKGVRESGKIRDEAENQYWNACDLQPLRQHCIQTRWDSAMEIMTCVSSIANYNTG